MCTTSEGPQRAVPVTAVSAAVGLTECSDIKLPAETRKGERTENFNSRTNDDIMAGIRTPPPKKKKRRAAGQLLWAVWG